MASPTSSNGADPTESTHPVRASLALESLDAETLWNALGAVERALPELLLCLKPILARLGGPAAAASETGPGASGVPEDKEGDSGGARRAVGDYLAILDDIQYVLRQATFYLHATKTSPSTLRPPAPTSIPTPFASTLPPSNPLLPAQSSIPPPPPGAEEDVHPDLGLYASRIEARTLGSMVEILREMRRGLSATTSQRCFGDGGAHAPLGEKEDPGQKDGDAMSIDQR
ncbi:hypothetical protein DB88DRAFT_498985 [Papiliotrema laurentii]|uniref:Mediator of RNA polymerase II transcription subunit 11 n=1 Tax=Papiliotrema laurentii TaxID=5418 RepID=A0AAD9FNR0_PAPLA|nr:hypothetical protein DB88DRAFT_498985 [Papiliotrema laurentii]